MKFPRRRQTQSSTSLKLTRIAEEISELVRPRKGAIALAIVTITVNRLAGIVLPASTKFVVDDIVGRKDVALLRLVVISILLSTVVQSLSSLAITRILSKAAHELIADTRKRLQRHVSDLPLTFYDENKTGTLLSRIMWDIDCVSNLVGTGLADFLGGLLSAFFAFIVLIRINSTMALATMAFVVALAILLARSFAKIRPMFLERKQLDAEVTGRLSESLAGIRVVKGYHAQEREHLVFAKGVQRILGKALQTLNAIARMNAASTILIGLIGATVMYLGVSQVIAGKLSLGGYFTATMFAALLITPVQQVVAIGVQVTESLAGLQRTRDVLSQKTEIMNNNRRLSIGKLEGRVEFHDVGFSYDRGRKVLHNISFRAEPGTVTAFIGPSGAGKSTMMGLIASFYSPDSGYISVDGSDLSLITLESYRTQLGLVLQESFLFDGSIRDNVAFSRPEASEADVLYACRLACVGEFAETFPEKYNTVIGERGVKLSGGQRQRVAIARAILANPRILILDEATSSLDTESESLIQAGLSHLMRGRTTFVIAHRLSTVRSADQILVIEDGRIVEHGTHSHLYAESGRYFEMYSQQNGAERDLLRV